MTRVRTAFWAGMGHSFGKEIKGKTAADALAAAGMDWKVETRPLFSQIGTDYVKAPACGVVRVTDNKVLGVVGEKYKVIQNGESLGGLDPLSTAGDLEFTQAWSLRGGSVIALQAKVPGKITLPGKDEIEQYLLYVTSHDGSINTRVMLIPHRLICSNQLNGVFGSRYNKGRAQFGFAVRHTKNADAKMQEGVKLLGQARQAFQWFGDRAKELSTLKFGEANLRRFVQAMFPTPKDDEGKEKPVPSQTQNARLKLLELFETGAGSELASANGTAWGAYNALTEYVDHERGTRTSDESERGVKRLESIWFGSGAALKTRAWDYLLTNGDK